MSKKKKMLDKLLEELIVPEEGQLFNLPNEWVWLRLKDVTEYIQRGKSPRYVEFSNAIVVSQKCVQWSGFDISVARYIDENSLDKYTDERFLRKHDILWNSTGTGTIGRLAIIDRELENKTVADSHVTVVRAIPSLIHPMYLYYWLAGPFVQGKLENSYSGSTNQIELNLSNVKNEFVPLPPMKEQIKIANKINILFSKFDEAKQLIEEAKVTFELRRAAILSKLYLLNPQKKEVSLGEICEIFSGKGFKKAEYADSGIKLLKIQNVSYRTTDWTEITYMPMEYLEKEPNLILHEGDIVIALNRPITQNKLKVTMLQEKDLPIILYQRVGCIRPKVEINQKYLYYYMTSSIFLTEVQSRLGGSDQPYINIPPLKSIKIPLISLEEQQILVEKIEKILLINKESEKIVDDILNIEILKQSMLSKAFKGELGTNDSNDEPAMDLLKSILQEK